MAKLNFLNNLGSNLKNVFSFKNTQLTNAFNRAFYRFIGGGYTEYDQNAPTYIEKGYNENSVVYSIIQQISTKAASVPLFIQNSKSKKEAKTRLRSKKIEIKSDHLTRIKLKSFDTVQDDPNFLAPPLDKPNPHQSWTEFFNLAETFLKLTGNIYFYMPRPESEFIQDKSPYAIYILPSHLMQIVLKANVDLVLDSNPVDHYMLTEGYVYDTFPAEDVVHITYSNPNFDLNGEHLYGQSPLRPLLKSIQLSNETMTQNIKTMQNAGVYGFIHGKQIPLQTEQAKELKDRLRDMDRDPSRLGRIAGISSEIGFTRLSLTSKELEPMTFLDYAERQIANCLNWSVLLLNNVDGAKYDNLKQIRQRVITDCIMPDLGLIEDALNDQILKRFKGYENSYCYFDYSLLPEMQADMKELVTWLSTALKDGAINRNEYREALNYEAKKEQEFNEYSVQFGVTLLEDALATTEELNIGNEVDIDVNEDSEDDDI